MNIGSASSASSGAPSNQKKDRGSIAAQACESCRARKHKCDENRPKCYNCQKLKLECTYREAQPTKKDKTLVEILDRLKILEGKVDRIPTRSVQQGGFGPLQVAPASQPSSPYPPGSVRHSQRESPSGRSLPYRHTSAAHKVLTWPAIKNLLQSIPTSTEDLRSLEADGSAFLLQMQQGTPNLPLDELLIDRPFVGMQMQATRASGGVRVTFPDLDYQTMHNLATSYFDSFNLLYPFMDRQNFLLDTLAKVHTEGFNGDTDSVIALLVFALGELALQATRGDPIDIYKGRPSGLRGGSVGSPPGLALFNEARRRIGFVLTECELKTVQIFSLAALYYEACSRHMDFWRLMVSASLACQVLITWLVEQLQMCIYEVAEVNGSNSIDWRTQRGDLIKRVFWHCVIMETGLHLELDLPLTGILALEESVDLPSFNGPFCEADHRCNEASHFEKHYASQLALRRLCTNLHSDINDSMSTNIDTPATSNEDFGSPAASTLKQVASQLDQWRSLLPPELQWPEDDPAVFPQSGQRVLRSYNQPLDPSLENASGAQLGEPLFTTDLDLEPALYDFAYDIQVALLRSRYYCAKYMVHRPFIYKALHFPDQMTPTDLQGAADGLKSCLKWPLALSPASRHKRLIPYLFCWSQNFLAILLILHLSRHTPALRKVRQQLGSKFEADAEASIEVMIDWIRDLKSTDPLAAWCYRVLERIYDMESLGRGGDEDGDGDEKM